MKTHFTNSEMRECLKKYAAELGHDPVDPDFIAGAAIAFLAMVASGEITVDQLRERLSA